MGLLSISKAANNILKFLLTLASTQLVLKNQKKKTRVRRRGVGKERHSRKKEFKVPFLTRRNHQTTTEKQSSKVVFHWCRFALIGKGGVWSLRRVLWQGLTPLWHPHVITHLSDWTLKKIEGLSCEQLPFSLSIMPAWLLEKWTAPAQSYSRILRGNMAPCSNNEILKASVTYNHTAKKERNRRGGETKRERESKVLISYKLVFKQPDCSLGSHYLSAVL